MKLLLLLALTSSLVFAQAERQIKTEVLGLQEVAAQPLTPSTGFYKIYNRAGTLYVLNSLGVEVEIGSGAGGGGGVSLWLTGTAYTTDTVIIQSNQFYIALADHLSGTFATDLSGGKWQALQMAAANVVNTAAGNLAATDVQGALNELQGDVDTNASAISGKQSTLTNSAGLAGALSDETGSGLAVFGTSPNITTPTGIVKGDVGLGNVDNTSDANKPVSTATQTALNLKADLASPALTGIPLAPTAAASTNNTQLATTAYADGAVTTSANAIRPLATGGTNNNLASPASGGVVYADASKLNVGSAGTSGQILQSAGTNAPSWVNKSISGKAQNGTAVTLEELQVPNNLLTSTATGKYLHETGNKNILANPSFEHSTATTGWTTTGTTATVSTNTAAAFLSSGAQSLKFAASSQIITLVQDSTLYASAFAGNPQGVISFDLFSTHNADITVCPRSAGVTLTTGCLTIGSSLRNGLIQNIVLPVIMSATSTGVSIVSASGTGDTYIDNVELKNDVLKQPSPLITAWQAYTPTFTGFGTATSIEFQWRQVGQNVDIRGKWVNGTTTATEARVTLPNSYVSAGSATIPSLQIAGHAVNAISATTVFSYEVLIEPSVAYVTFGNQRAATNATTKTNGDNFQSSGITSFFASIPIAGLQGSTSIYSASCGANCVDEFPFSVSSTGVVSGDDLDIINANCTNATPSVCTFNSGKFTVAPECDAHDNGSSGFMCSAYGETTSGFNITCTDSTGASSAAISKTVTCSKKGADFTATRTIVGSFNEVMTTPNVSKPKTCYYSFGGASATLAAPTECTTGTCVEVYDSCGTGTPPAWATTAVYNNMTFASGTWANSSPIDCKCKAYDTVAASPRKCENYFDTSDQSWASNASGGAVLNLYGTTTAGAENTVYIQLECEGQAP